MKKIKLTQNKVALIDDEDYGIVSLFKWNANKTTRTSYYASTGSGVWSVLMHRLIMNAPQNMQVDHINTDSLDNRKKNLRICTRSENQHNQKVKRASSIYKGVSWHSRDKGWHSSIKNKGKDFYCGLYSSEEEAALAYNYMAKHYFGKFARLNII